MPRLRVDGFTGRVVILGSRLRRSHTESFLEGLFKETQGALEARQAATLALSEGGSPS